MLKLKPESVSLMSKSQLLSIIQAQSDIIDKRQDVDTAMKSMAQLAQDLTFAAGAVVEMADGDEMVYRAATGKAEDNLGMRLKRSNSLSGLCVEKGELLRCDDSEQDPRVDKEACRAVGLRSMLVVPLYHHQALVGALKVFSPNANGFDDVDMTILQIAAKVIGAVLNADSAA